MRADTDTVMLREQWQSHWWIWCGKDWSMEWNWCGTISSRCYVNCAVIRTRILAKLEMLNRHVICVNNLDKWTLFGEACTYWCHQCWTAGAGGIVFFWYSAVIAGQWLPSLGRRQSTTKNSGHCCRHPRSSRWWALRLGKIAEVVSRCLPRGIGGFGEFGISQTGKLLLWPTSKQPFNVKSTGDAMMFVFSFVVLKQLRCDRTGERWVGIEVGVTGQQHDGSGRDGRLSPAVAVRSRTSWFVPVQVVGQWQWTVADVTVTKTLGSHQRLVSVSNSSSSPFLCTSERFLCPMPLGVCVGQADTGQQ